MNADVVDILPPLQARTGCDTTSKIDAKAASIKTAKTNVVMSSFFGKTELTDEIIDHA